MRAPTLFSTIPREDYVHLFHNGEPDGNKVVDFLKYKKEDVATAANIPISSVRYDQKIPAELKERLTEWAIAINLVAEFFQDEEKTMLWFAMPNILLGGMSPREMIRVGRFKKLLNFIQTALDENKR
jgi:hypothetical protein